MSEVKSDKHLTYFKVENFKNFSTLELEDISLFNVIVGDNNVGKTNLLESISLNETNIISSLENLLEYIYQRNGHQSHANLSKDYISSYFNNSSNNKKINFFHKYNNDKESYASSLTIRSKDELSKSEYSKFMSTNHVEIGNISRILEYKNKTDTIFIDTNFTNYFKYAPDETSYMPVIFSNQCNGKDLIEFYGKTISKSKEQKKNFIQKLDLFFHDIENIEISQSNFNDEYEIFIGFKNTDSLFPLSMFGDGAVKYFRILMEILLVQGARLSIDEIDNGIHYSKQVEFIEKIILSSIENNTQIFCTTHSLECLKAIKQAFNNIDINHRDLFRCFSLNKIKNGETKSYKYSFAEFSSTLESDADIRGGF